MTPSIHDIDRISRTGRVPRMVTVACLCGGTLRGDRYAPAAYVQAHNRSRLHKAWRERREGVLEAERLMAEKLPVVA